MEQPTQKLDMMAVGLIGIITDMKGVVDEMTNDADLKWQFEMFCSEISGDMPNSETIEAIKEVKEMETNSDFGKTYINLF